MSKSQYSGFFSNKVKTKFEQLLVHKLGYEWKQIYRVCVSLDSEAHGILHIEDFLKTCEKFGVSLIPLEVKQILRIYSVASDPEDANVFGFENNLKEAEEIINFKKLSMSLGLHKESFNYLSKVQSQNRIHNISKLRQLYQQN